MNDNNLVDNLADNLADKVIQANCAKEQEERLALIEEEVRRRRLEKQRREDEDRAWRKRMRLLESLSKPKSEPVPAMEVYIDDLGIKALKGMEKDRQLFMGYIVQRCRIINPGLNRRLSAPQLLFHGSTLVPNNAKGIMELAYYSGKLTESEAALIYRQLRDTSPVLDETRLIVAEGLAWNTEMASFESIRAPVTQIATNRFCQR